ncbi:MAG: PD-(D/E)XK nuclease family protein [Candidatus Micrarchaeales archaeon]|jgi:hypothetical protein|uniref:PD-(D/E)XK endonuclease-like domain-containing protein n=1 Tax=Candidatus Micrarchaeum acidiphilum ARMAN-2 TaxID=425595 RepID=C7DHG0_MICA2|nr:MAG: hypothetical protein UNLARM2_0504 [Candidatus Micrarchaeum acidiphilum ARMAN-2]MCW6160630.1 PD-(D/E)XK nuclease family protein [Candidatus Micrarchaeales archaeon]
MILNALQRLHKNSIRVTDIASQYWCEKQMELNYIVGPKITAEIKKGLAMHQDLEKESNVPVILQPKSYSDVMYKILYTNCVAIDTLKENKKSREIAIYGSANGYKMVGKIDELELKNGEVVVFEDKTRATDKVPSEPQMKTHKIQVMVYRKMLSDIAEGKYNEKNFKRSYDTQKLKITDEFQRQLAAIEVDKSMMTVDAVADMFFEKCRRIGKIGNTLYLRYINQFTGKVVKLHKFEYSESEFNSTMEFSLKYWNGEREALPVPFEEKWKCPFCAFFGKECKVWWPQQKL